MDQRCEGANEARPGRQRRRAAWAFGAVAMATYIFWAATRTDEAPIVRVSADPSRWREAIGRLLGRGSGFNARVATKLTDAELERAATLNGLARQINHRQRESGSVNFANARDALEAALAEDAGSFQAEYLLSQWHAIDGDAEAADVHRERAFELAPAVLVIPFELSDGEPWRDAVIPITRIELNGVNATQSSISMRYDDLATDDRGRIYLPVYDAVYRWGTRSAPAGEKVHFPTLGFFESPAHFGVLPVSHVWRAGDGPEHQPDYEGAPGTEDLKLALGGNEFTIADVARLERDGSVEREDGRGGASNGAAIALDEAPAERARWLDKAAVQIGLDPALYDIVEARVFDHATRLPVAGVPGAGSTARLQIKADGRVVISSRGERLPGKIDLWLKVVSHETALPLATVQPVAGAILTAGADTAVLTAIESGSRDWNMLAQGVVPAGRGPEFQTTVHWDRGANWTWGRRVAITPIDVDGVAHLEERFYDFGSMLNAVRILDVPLERIDHFEVRPFKQAEKFFFDGIALPSVGELEATPASVEIEVGGEEIYWTSSDPDLVELEIGLVRGRYGAFQLIRALVGTPADQRTGSREGSEARETTLFWWARGRWSGLQSRLEVLDAGGEAIVSRDDQSSRFAMRGTDTSRGLVVIDRPIEEIARLRIDISNR